MDHHTAAERVGFGATLRKKIAFNRAQENGASISAVFVGEGNRDEPKSGRSTTRRGDRHLKNQLTARGKPSEKELRGGAKSQRRATYGQGGLSNQSVKMPEVSAKRLRNPSSRRYMRSKA